MNNPKQTRKNPNFKHGMKNTRFYRIFISMKSRCKNINDHRCKNHGYKGIRVDWNNFIEFMEDMYEGYISHCAEHGEKNTTIDRIDGTSNYCKDNCRWSTYKAQNNNASSNIILEYNDKKQTLQQWCDELGLTRSCLYKRIVFRGWSIEKAFNTKPMKNKYV